MKRPQPAEGIPERAIITCWLRCMDRLSLRQFWPFTGCRPSTLQARHAVQRSGSHSRPAAKQGQALVRQSPVLQRQPPKKFGQGLRVDFAKGPARGPIACAAAAAATATDEKPAGLLPAPPRPFGTGRQDREDEEDEDEDEDADADKEMADLTPPPGMFSICSGGAQ